MGPLLFTVVYLIEGVTRVGCDAWRTDESHLSLGKGGWVQIVSFVVIGLLMMGFAAGVLLAVFGLSLVLASLFAADPSQGYPQGTPPGPAREPLTKGRPILMSRVQAAAGKVGRHSVPQHV